MRQLRLYLAAGMVIALIIAGPTAALAAAPTNDTFAGAEVIASLPFSDSLNTTEATTDTVDAEANEQCGAPATEASVWYSFTPASDIAVLVDVSESDYSAGALVASGSPGSLVVENCGPGSTVFFATSGVTYHIMAFDDTPGGGNGGNLEIDVTEAPPPPEVAVTIDPVGHFDKAGNATVTGTFTCTGDADFIDLSGHVRQRAGRVFIDGDFFQFFDGSECDGTAHPWSGTTEFSNGIFRGGRATVDVALFACSAFCGEAFESRTISLRG